MPPAFCVGARSPRTITEDRTIAGSCSGLVRRAELRAFLRSLSKSIPDKVISGLIDYVDTDGDSKTLTQKEFVKMMEADFLE